MKNLKQKKAWQAGRLFACGVLFGFTGCVPETAPDKHVGIFDTPKQQIEGPRFKVETAGKFNAGFGNNVREILILTDTETGRKYIGVTGVGISELQSEATVTTDSKGHVRTETHTREW